MTTPTFRRSLMAHILNATYQAKRRGDPPPLIAYVALFIAALALTCVYHLRWGAQ